VAQKAKVALVVFMGSAALTIAARWVCRNWPAAVRAEDLAAAYAANPDEADRVYLGRTLTVSGAWLSTGPAPGDRHITLCLRGAGGLRVHCLFDDVPMEDRNEFEAPLLGIDVLNVRGLCAGRVGDHVLLRECRLLD